MKQYQRLKIASVLCLSLLGLNAYSGTVLREVPEYCKGPSVLKTQLPLYPGNSSSPQFEYRYQLLSSKGPNDPTIIFIPGGPGGTSIRNWDDRDPSVQEIRQRPGFPREANLIFTDPRSVGCNWGSEKDFPDDSLSTEMLAWDVVQLVQKLQPKEYYLYGHSYGSQVATVVASLLEKEKIIPPRGIVLTGAIGRATQGPEEVTASQLSRIWNELKAPLSTQSLNILKTSRPLGFSEEEWTGFLNFSLTRGRVWMNGKLSFPLKERLPLLGSENPRDLDLFKKEIEMIFAIKPPQRTEKEKLSRTRIMQMISCREMSMQDYSFQFKKGNILKREKTDCGKWHLDRPFNSENWPITRPIFYISGNNDPVTPPFQALFHFKSQKRAPRYWVHIPLGGHNQIGETLLDCKEALWNSIRREGRDLAKTLSQCEAQPSLEAQVNR